MKEYKPPYNIRTLDLYKKSIFLAGTIEMGDSIDWQKDIVEFLKDDDGIILNPRRDNWDSSWEQKKENIEFREQVEWELYGIKNSSIVIFNFLPNSKSPITMLELGLCLNEQKALVCCPEGFWRKGNIDVSCAFFGIPVFIDYDEFKENIKLIVGNN
jgi:hypothetical protein